jgi:hypothetical protein
MPGSKVKVDPVEPVTTLAEAQDNETLLPETSGLELVQADCPQL